MSIDVSQFHHAFFEESFEGLEIMESGLINLDVGTADAEAINTIFRAAHSIKGGAGTFGFLDITDFTHVMETLLDEMRAGRREVTREEIDLLLQGVDCLREIMAATHHGTRHDQERIAACKSALERVLAQVASAPAATMSTPAPAGGSVAESPAATLWEIEFTPFRDLFRSGNDPARIFRELAEFGDFVATPILDELPPLEALESESCYLAWRLRLSGSISEAQISDVFAWVDTECRLSITKVQPPESESEPEPEPEPEPAAAKASAADAVVAPVTAAEVKKTGDNRPAASTTTEVSSIRVSIEKIDALINLVGELVITQSMLSEIGATIAAGGATDKLHDGLVQLARNTREMQQSVLSIRMLPISFSFNRFPRLVRDLSTKLGKKIELRLSGENTELDKTVMEKIGDPLVHLVRNSLDHGIEAPDKRRAAGKPETGVLHLNAYHEGGNIVIEITDDGAGLNRERILRRAKERGLVPDGVQPSDAEICELIFLPGFSTAEVVSDVSGRGVGMDVVRRNIKDLGGVVEVKSVEGCGSTFTIRLPLTLAILDGQLVRIGNHTYIVPIVSIIESLQIDPRKVNAVAGKAELYKLREEYISIVRLYQLFNIPPENEALEKGLLVIVEGDGQRVGLFVDDLLAQQQVVIKSLESNYQSVPGISGATILGDGHVALILDVAGIIEQFKTSAGTVFKNLLTDSQYQAA